MLNWFKRLRVPKSPTFNQIVIGELQIDSNVLLLADPMCMYDPVRVENLPQGRYAVQAQIINYPEGGQRIAKIGIGIRPGAIEARQTLGTIGVDSAIVVALDGRVHEKFWKEVWKCLSKTDPPACRKRTHPPGFAFRLNTVQPNTD